MNQLGYTGHIALIYLISIYIYIYIYYPVSDWPILIGFLIMKLHRRGMSGNRNRNRIRNALCRSDYFWLNGLTCKYNYNLYIYIIIQGFILCLSITSLPWFNFSPANKVAADGAIILGVYISKRCIFKACFPVFFM